MSFLEFALHMFPYWILGGSMAFAVSKSSYKDLLAFNVKSFLKFFAFMCVLSVYRYFVIKLAISHNIGTEQLQAARFLPIGGVFFTPWEDFAHSLPLVLLRRMLGTSKWTYPIHALLTAIVTVSFGCGHLYQGIISAAILSLYIPFSVNFASKKGFGTLAVCHVLYDFATLMTVRMLI